MKALLILSVLFFSSLAFSFPPYDMCQHEGQCSVAQDEMYKRFQACSGYDPQKNSGRVYAGTCYHSGKAYRNTDAHTVGMYFDIVNEVDPRFGGSFGFFHKENPYKKLTNQQAEVKYSSSIKKKDHTLNISSGEYGHVFWEKDLPESTVGYWFKTCGKKVYLQGAWGYHHQFICELEPNEKLPVSASNL